MASAADGLLMHGGLLKRMRFGYEPRLFILGVREPSLMSSRTLADSPAEAAAAMRAPKTKAYELGSLRAVDTLPRSRDKGVRELSGFKLVFGKSKALQLWADSVKTRDQWLSRIMAAADGLGDLTVPVPLEGLRRAGLAHRAALLERAADPGPEPAAAPAGVASDAGGVADEAGRSAPDSGPAGGSAAPAGGEATRAKHEPGAGAGSAVSLGDAPPGHQRSQKGSGGEEGHAAADARPRPASKAARLLGVSERRLPTVSGAPGESAEARGDGLGQGPATDGDAQPAGSPAAEPGLDAFGGQGASSAATAAENADDAAAAMAGGGPSAQPAVVPHAGRPGGAPAPRAGSPAGAVPMVGGGKPDKAARLLGVSRRRVVQAASSGVEMADFAAGLLSAEEEANSAAAAPPRAAEAAALSRAGGGGGSRGAEPELRGFVVRDGVDGSGFTAPRSGEAAPARRWAKGKSEALLLPDTSYLDVADEGGGSGCCCAVA